MCLRCSTTWCCSTCRSRPPWTRAIREIESGTHVHRRGPGGRSTTKRYFHPVFASRPAISDAERSALYQRIADVMDDSVAKHMRADVTVGAFLSGGIDSTAIAALAKRYNPDLMTFTTGFEREGYSEVDVAAESAAAIGVRHVIRTVSEQELTETLPLIVWYLDDPVADPALVPLYFVANEARKHVKVVLSGEGADELFGGYNIYREPISLRPHHRAAGRHAQGPGRGRTRAAAGLPRARTCCAAARSTWRTGTTATPGSSARSSSPGCCAPTTRRARSGTSPTRSTRRPPSSDPIARMQHVDLFTWLRGDILVKADKMTMANSLELRVPFLDTEVFEVARTIPTDQKVTKQTTKLALRRAMELIVPPHVLHRRKLGFPVPIRHFLAEGSYDWARDDHHRGADRRVPGPGRGAGPAGRAPGRRGRLLPADLDDPGVPALARDLRHRRDHAGDPGAGLPGPALTVRPRPASTPAATASRCAAMSAAASSP